MKWNAACIQLNAGNNIDANILEAEALCRAAVAEGAEFLALPENAIYLEDLRTDKREEYTEAEHRAVSFFAALAKDLNAWILVGSIAILPEKDDPDQRYFNRSYLFDAAGNICDKYDKIHLFDADVTGDRNYRESKRYRPGGRAVVADVPFGKLGLTICYDLRFPYLYREMALGGANIIAVPAAFTRKTGEVHWEILLRARAIETGCYIIAPGQTGIHPGKRETYGHSLIIDPWGEVLADAGKEPGYCMVTLDTARVEECRGNMPSLINGREYLRGWVGDGGGI